MPVIGQFQISDIARVSYILHERWGRIVRLGGLLGRPDLLFVYDADEIEKVSYVVLIKNALADIYRYADELNADDSSINSIIYLAFSWLFLSKVTYD